MVGGAKDFFVHFFGKILNPKAKNKIEIPDENCPLAFSSGRKILSGISKIFLVAKTNEIYLNQTGDLSYFEYGETLKVIGGYCTPTELMDFIWFLAWESQVRIDPLRPHGGGVVAGQSLRWHAVIPPVAPDGPSIVIRKQAFRELDLSSFVLENFVAHDFVAWLQSGVSIVFYGPTGSGKTSLLFAVMKRFFLEARVGIIESILEMPLLSKCWFRLVEVGQDVSGQGGIDFDRVFAEMMRLSPRVVVLGEIRVAEAGVLLQLSRTGHGGVMTTIHAGSMHEVKDRLVDAAKCPLASFPRLIGVNVRSDKNGQYHCTADMLN